MTAKELKKLRRSDLLEMMLDLTKENEQLRQQLEQAQKQLEDRTIAILDSGTMAEAVFRLNGVFEAAQAACDQYIENMKLRSGQHDRMMEQETNEKEESHG